MNDRLDDNEHISANDDDDTSNLAAEIDYEEFPEEKQSVPEQLPPVHLSGEGARTDLKATGHNQERVTSQPESSTDSKVIGPADSRSISTTDSPRPGDAVGPHPAASTDHLDAKATADYEIDIRRYFKQDIVTPLEPTKIFVDRIMVNTRKELSEKFKFAPKEQRADMERQSENLLKLALTGDSTGMKEFAELMKKDPELAENLANSIGSALRDRGARISLTVSEGKLYVHHPERSNQGIEIDENGKTKVVAIETGADGSVTVLEGRKVLRPGKDEVTKAISTATAGDIMRREIGEPGWAPPVRLDDNGFFSDNIRPLLRPSKVELEAAADNMIQNVGSPREARPVMASELASTLPRTLKELFLANPRDMRVSTPTRGKRS